MPRDQHHLSVPVGPGARGHLLFPSFAADPVAWFEAVDGLLASNPDAVRAARPETWTDPAGHAWRVVVTADGPEVRPGLENPFLVQGPLPRITAMLVTPPSLAVELSMLHWRQVTLVPAAHCSVRNLGLAMLTGVELPHEGLERIGADTWDQASVRWEHLRSAQVGEGLSVGRHRTTLA